MKTAIKIILLLGVVGYLIFAIVQFAQPIEEQVCEAVDVRLTDSVMSSFINESYVHRILQKNKIFAEGQKASSLNMQQIEEVLRNDPYIEEVDCYCSAANHLCIIITPQHPVMHVIAQNGEDYYMDSNGTIMPIGDLNLDLCVVTGNLTKKSVQKSLIALASYIYNDSFWNEQIQQINVLADNDVELIPRVGNQTILLGSCNNYEEKLGRLLLFYQKGLPKVGWNKYSTINLTYDGQIVCTKKTTNKTF